MFMSTIGINVSITHRIVKTISNVQLHGKGSEMIKKYVPQEQKYHRNVGIIEKYKIQYSYQN